jgi:tetratricopeptide (TPR) repeat protein
MSRIRINPEDERRGRETYRAALAYERQVQSTAAGRRSLALRNRAHPFANRNQDDQALPLYKEALSILPDDDSAATCSARFDLGVCYLNCSGVDRDNLLEARRLLERCLTSPIWRSDPKRVALSQDALGRAFRRLADYAHDKEARRRAEAAALKNIVEACLAVSRLGTIGWVKASCYHQNLGNLLQQLRRHDEAVTAYDEGVRFARAAFDHPHEPFVAEALSYRHDDLLADALVNLAGGLVRRAKEGDAQRALLCAEEASTRADPVATARSAIVTARAHLALGQPAEAVAKLRRLDSTVLPEGVTWSLLEAAKDAGAEDVVIAVAHRGIAEALAERRYTLADHVAQNVDQRGQRYGLALAQAYARAGRAVDAFLALENVSGLSWYDRVTRYYRPVSVDPLASAAGAVQQLHAVYARDLDAEAGRLAHLPRSAQTEMSLELAQGIEEPDPDMVEARDRLDPSVRTVVDRIAIDTAGHLRAAAAAASPVTAVRDEAQRHAAERERLEQIMGARWPELAAKPFWNTEMQARDLDTILDEEIGRVLVRVHVSKELFAVALWREDGATHGRIVQRPVVGQPWLSRTAADGDGLEEALRGLDLAEVLPDNAQHVVLLPSLMAMFVPWAATGLTPLVQRCGAISILPSLVALWGRQTSSDVRSGTLTVVPGAAAERSTRFHAVVLAAGVPEEVQLTEGNATSEQLRGRVAGADVVTFYAHGDGGPEAEDAGIFLADGLLEPMEAAMHWAGLERVELWACRSGVNLPTDWLTPMVDDGFGLDVDLHYLGVRSTIGTLWDASDFVTACLVHRYRAEIRGGALAPHALAAAQRWWLTDAVPDIERRLATEPEQRAFAGFLADLGVHPTGVDMADTQLGPVDMDRPLSGSGVASRVASLRSPRSWAGYRFVGVAERRPTSHASVRMTLTDAERADLSAFLQTKPPMPLALDDAWDTWIAEARHDAPDIATAVRVARLFADRRRSSPAHNLLRGLAWLHEALAHPWGPEQRRRLQIEAAWMWTELALGGCADEAALAIHQVPPGILPRIDALLDDGVESAAIRGWTQILRSSPNDKPEAARRAFQVLQGRLGEPGMDNHARLRLWACAAELLLLAGPTRESVGVLKALRLEEPVAVLDAVRTSRWALYLSLCHDRLVHGSGASQAGGSPRGPVYRFSIPHLPQRDVGRATRLISFAIDDPHFRFKARDEADRALSLIEEAFWGQPSDEQVVYHKTTGSPGRAWRGAEGAYLTSSAREPEAQGRAAHYLAWLQLSADLRVTSLGALGRLAAALGDEQSPPSLLWHLLWARDCIVGALEDVVGLPRIESGFDPYDTGNIELRNRLTEEGGDHALWLLIDAVSEFWEQEFPARTAAMSAELQLRWLDERIDGVWSAYGGLPPDASLRARESKAMLDEALDPGLRVTEVEKSLREVSPDEVILGLTVGGMGDILAFAIWNDGRQLQQRVYAGPPQSGLLARNAQMTLSAPAQSDYGPRAGDAPARERAWQQLVAILEPALRAVLTDAVHAKRHLAVFAPGPFRAIPAAALQLSGAPLRQRFASVALLPDLRFGRSKLTEVVSATRPLICTFGEERVQGETGFGAAAITTLRRWFPPDVATEPRKPVGMDIVEVPAIQEGGPRAAVVRFYGVGSPAELTPSSAGLRLGGDRTFSIQNMRHLTLGHCRAVELWAATSPVGEAWGMLHRGTDTLPPLVRGFLASGAHGVLDLAWPVHDVVKALVVEQFAILRESENGPDSLLLGAAVCMVEEVLERWRSMSAGFTDVRMALRSLDDFRRYSANSSGLDPRAVVPFEPLYEAPCVATSVAELVGVLTRPSQLGACRWWGR